MHSLKKNLHRKALSTRAESLEEPAERAERLGADQSPQVGSDQLGISRFGLVEQQKIQRPQNQTEGLARTGAGNDQQRTIGVRDDLALRFIHRRELLEN